MKILTQNKKNTNALDKRSSKRKLVKFETKFTSFKTQSRTNLREEKKLTKNRNIFGKFIALYRKQQQHKTQCSETDSISGRYGITA